MIPPSLQSYTTAQFAVNGAGVFLGILIKLQGIPKTKGEAEMEKNVMLSEIMALLRKAEPEDIAWVYAFLRGYIGAANREKLPEKKE